MDREPATLQEIIELIRKGYEINGQRLIVSGQWQINKPEGMCFCPLSLAWIGTKDPLPPDIQGIGFSSKLHLPRIDAGAPTSQELAFTFDDIVLKEKGDYPPTSKANDFNAYHTLTLDEAIEYFTQAWNKCLELPN